jgi:hypothetical protein
LSRSRLLGDTGFDLAREHLAALLQHVPRVGRRCGRVVDDGFECRLDGRRYRGELRVGRQAVQNLGRQKSADLGNAAVFEYRDPARQRHADAHLAREYARRMRRIANVEYPALRVERMAFLGQGVGEVVDVQYAEPVFLHGRFEVARGFSNGFSSRNDVVHGMSRSESGARDERSDRPRARRAFGRPRRRRFRWHGSSRRWDCKRTRWACHLLEAQGILLCSGAPTNT